MEIPEPLLSKKESLFTVLKEAMDVNKGAGIWGSDKNIFEITLDLSGVIING